MCIRDRLYIDDVLIHGTTESDILINLRKVFDRLREHNVAANPRKAKLGLVQVEYVVHLISEKKRLKVLNFQLSGLTSEIMSPIWRYYTILSERCVQPIRYTGAMANWTPERIHAYESCQQAISNCQELYFLDDTATPIVQTDASDYGIGGYDFMVTSAREVFRLSVKWSLVIARSKVE